MESLSAAPFHLIVEFLNAPDIVSLAKTNKFCHRFVATTAGECWCCPRNLYSGEGSSMGCSTCFACGDCCAEIRECDNCNASRCFGCEMEYCESCDSTQCYGCRAMFNCHDCHTLICTDCEDMMACSKCYTRVCDDCNGDKILIYTCGSCEDRYCTECEPVACSCCGERHYGYMCTQCTDSLSQ